MEEIPILQDLAVMLVLSMFVLWASHRLKIPPIIGLLFTGLLAGPYGLQAITEIKGVEHLAEIGVILLLFAIGLEFSFAELARIGRAVFIGGSLQAGLTIGLGLGIASLFEVSWQQGVFWGFLLALSSTAIVLRLQQERHLQNSPQGQTLLAILIFQDLLIVPLILLTPLLGGMENAGGDGLWVLGGKSLVIILFVVVMARWVAPWMLYRLAATRSRELFLLSICSMVLGVTWLTHWAGLSVGLGAFLAGLIISESEYAHFALASITPFRDVFSSFFFISIGMLLDFQFFFSHFPIIFALVVALVLIKALTAAFAVLALGLGLRIGVYVGFGLAQIGEFSFVLSKVGMQYDLLSAETYQYFLAASVASLALTPALLSLGQVLSDRAQRSSLPPLLSKGWNAIPLAEKDQFTKMENHILIAGFGLTGRILAKAAQAVKAPYLVLEMNPDTVKKERAKGVNIIYGDVGREECLHQAGIAAAKIVVLAINDPKANELAVSLVKQQNPAVWLIVRTHFVTQLERLYGLGADEVIPAEYETALSIFSRILHKYQLPQEEIEEALQEARNGGYGMVRGFRQSRLDLQPFLGDHDLMNVTLTDKSPLVGQTLAQSNLRKQYNLTLLAIRRKGQTIAHPGADDLLLAQDGLLLLGSKKDLCRAADLFHATGHEKACRI